MNYLVTDAFEVFSLYHLAQAQTKRKGSKENRVKRNAMLFEFHALGQWVIMLSGNNWHWTSFSEI